MTILKSSWQSFLLGDVFFSKGLLNWLNKVNEYSQEKVQNQDNYTILKNEK